MDDVDENILFFKKNLFQFILFAVLLVFCYSKCVVVIVFPLWW